MRVHPNPDAGVWHTCGQCERHFVRAARLKEPMAATHSTAANRESFPCPHCPATFTLRDNVCTHIKSMHKKCTQMCDECQKQVAYGKQNEHMNRKHGDACTNVANAL